MATATIASQMRTLVRQVNRLERENAKLTKQNARLSGGATKPAAKKAAGNGAAGRRKIRAEKAGPAAKKGPKTKQAKLQGRKQRPSEDDADETPVQRGRKAKAGAGKTGPAAKKAALAKKGPAAKKAGSATAAKKTPKKEAASAAPAKKSKKADDAWLDD